MRAFLIRMLVPFLATFTAAALGVGVGWHLAPERVEVQVEIPAHEHKTVTYGCEPCFYKVVTFIASNHPQPAPARQPEGPPAPQPQKESK